MKLKILIFTFIFALGCLNVFAGTEPAPAAYEAEGNEILWQLGVVEGIDFSDPQDNITRAQFAAMLIRGANLSKVSYDELNYFADVDAEDEFADEIATLCYWGIASGTGEALFSPQGEVTLCAAYKMISTALGYSEWATVYGGWPTGYIRMANDLDLNVISNKDTNSAITLSDACLLIEAMLKACPADVSSVSQGGVEFSKSTQTLLERAHNLSVVQGICTSAGSSSVLSDFSYDTTSLINLDYANDYKTSLKGVEKYLGYEVSLWYDKTTNYVMCIEKTDSNKAVTLSAEAVLSMDDYVLYTEDVQSGKETKYRLDKAYSFVKNGRLANPQEDDFDFDVGSLTLIDNNGDKSYDFVICHRAEYFVIGSYSEYERSIYDKNMGSVPIILDSTGENHASITVYEEDGKSFEADMATIKKNMVLTVYRSDDSSYVDAVGCTKTVKGKITEVGKDYVVINGEQYKKNYYFDKFYSQITLGSEGDFLLAHDGTITAFLSGGNGSMKYGYYMDYSTGSGISTNARIKLLNTDGQVCIYNLSKKVKFDGDMVAPNSDAVREKLIKNSLPVYQVIRYSLDSEGLLNVIDTAVPVDDTESAEDKYRAVVQTDNSLTCYVDKTEIHYKNSGLAYPYFNTDGVLTFKVPKSMKDGITGRYEDHMFTIAKFTELEDDDEVFVDAYDFGEAFDPAVAVMYNGMGTVGIIEAQKPIIDATAYVVDSVTDAIDPEGNVTKKVVIYDKGKFASYYISEDVLPALTKDDLIPQSGDIVRLSIINGNTINGVARDVKYNPETKKASVQYGGDVSSNVGYMNTYATGKVFSVSKNVIALKYEDFPSNTSGYSPIKDGISPYVFNTALVFAIYNTEEGRVEHASVDDILSIMGSGEDNASYVALKTRYLSPRLAVVYK